MAASTSEDSAGDRYPASEGSYPLRLALCQPAYSHFFHLKKK